MLCNCRFSFFLLFFIFVSISGRSGTHFLCHSHLRCCRHVWQILEILHWIYCHISFEILKFRACENSMSSALEINRNGRLKWNYDPQPLKRSYFNHHNPYGHQTWQGGDILSTTKTNQKMRKSFRLAKNQYYLKMYKKYHFWFTFKWNGNFVRRYIDYTISWTLFLMLLDVAYNV